MLFMPILDLPPDVNGKLIKQSPPRQIIHPHDCSSSIYMMAFMMTLPCIILIIIMISSHSPGAMLTPATSNLDTRIN